MGRRIDTLWVPPSVGCNGSQRRIQMARLSRPDSPRVAPAGRAERGGPGGRGPGGPRRRRRPPAASRRARPRALTRRVNVTNPTHFPTPLCRALDDAQVNAHVVTHKVISRAVSNDSIRIRAPRLDVRTLRSRCVARPLRGPYFPSPIPSAKLCRSLRAYWPLMACCTAAAHCAASSSVAALNGIEISTEV